MWKFSLIFYWFEFKIGKLKRKFNYLFLSDCIWHSFITLLKNVIHRLMYKCYFYKLKFVFLKHKHFMCQYFLFFFFLIFHYSNRKCLPVSFIVLFHSYILNADGAYVVLINENEVQNCTKHPKLNNDRHTYIVPFTIKFMSRM